MSELLNKTITVLDIRLEEKRIYVMDTEKKGYSIWRTKQDGSPTKAFEVINKYLSMPINGKHFEIGYDERPNPNKAGTFFRSIKMIKEVNANGTEKPVGSVPAGNDTENRLKSLELRVSRLEGSLGLKNTPNSDLETKNSTIQAEQPLTQDELAQIPF